MRTLLRHLFNLVVAAFAMTVCQAFVAGVRAAPDAGGKILNLIPADAQWFLVANDIGRLNQRLARMERAVPLPQSPDALTGFVSALQLNFHAMDLHGTVVLVQMPYKNPQPGTIPAPHVYLLPSTHLRHLFRHEQLTRHRGGIFQLRSNNVITAWAVQSGPYVVRARSRRTLKAFLAARKFWTGKLSAAEVAALRQPGICVLDNVRAGRQYTIQSIDRFIDSLNVQFARSKNRRQQMLPFVCALYAAIDLIEQAKIVLLVAHPHSHGISVQAFINFQKHSATADFVPACPVLGARPLAGLPDTQFTVAGAMATNPQALRRWCQSFDDFISKADPALGHSQSAFLKPWLATLRGLTHPITRSLEMLPVNMNKPPVFRAVSISTSADMANHFAAHQHNLLALAQSWTAMMKSNGMYLKPLQSKSARTIAGVPFSTFTIRMAPVKPGAPVGFTQKELRHLEQVVTIGANGLDVESGLVGHHLISGANVENTLLAATVANVQNNHDPLDRAPVVRAMRKYMLEKCFFVAFSPWFAISAQSRGPVLRVKAYIPAASLKYLGAIMLLEMMRD